MKTNFFRLKIWDYIGLIIWTILLIFQIYNLIINVSSIGNYITIIVCIIVIFLYIMSIYKSKKNKNVKE